MKENSLKMGQNKMIEKVFCGPLKNYISMVEKKCAVLRKVKMYQKCQAMTKFVTQIGLQ